MNPLDLRKAMAEWSTSVLRQVRINRMIRHNLKADLAAWIVDNEKILELAYEHWTHEMENLK